jgi:uncharacterized protein
MDTMKWQIAVDGKTVDVQVYPDDEGGWLLELVDEYGNSTCWEDAFATAELAFEEAARAVDEEGIEAFIGVGEDTVH